MTATTQERPGWGPEAAHKSFGGDTHSLRDNGPVRLPEDVVEHFNRCAVRNVEQTILDARPSTWERRARDLENARPRPDEYHGQATAEDLAERDQRLAEQAEACREHAELLRRYPTPLTVFERSVVAAIIEGGGTHGDRVDAA